MILRDAMTGESSLIGLMPTMQVTLQLPEDHPDDKINIQIGPGAIMALFRSAEPAKQKTVLDLDVTLSFPGQRQEAKAQLEFKPGGQFCQVCMALAMVQ